MKYSIYILASKSTGYIYGPINKHSVWIAFVKDDGSTYIPEDTSKIEAINGYHKSESDDFDTVIKMTWNAYSASINTHCGTLEDFTRVANQSLSDWTKNSSSNQQEQEFGATCKKCNNFNDYAIKSTSYICKSCKSYDEMYQ